MGWIQDPTGSVRKNGVRSGGTAVEDHQGQSLRCWIRTSQGATPEGMAQLLTVVDDFSVSAAGRLVTLDELRGVRVWNVPDWRPVAVGEAFETGLGAVAFTPKGERFVAIGDSGDLRVWDTETGIQILRFPVGVREVRDLQFGAASGWLAMVGMDGDLFLVPAGFP